MKAHCSMACGVMRPGKTLVMEVRNAEMEVKTPEGSTIQSSRYSEYLEKVIRIRTEYEARWGAIVLAIIIEKHTTFTLIV